MLVLVLVLVLDVADDGSIEYEYRSLRSLSTSTSTNWFSAAAYEIKGNEGYVRARVTDSAGGKAWTQPVFVP